MHLHGELMERYLTGDMDGRIQTAIDAHVSNCLPCARALSRVGVAAERWERRGWLGRLARVGREPAGAVPARARTRSPGARTELDRAA